MGGAGQTTRRSKEAELGELLSSMNRYLLCGSLFAKSFDLKEKRGISWWAIQKLLEGSDFEKPENWVRFKDLCRFLEHTPPSKTDHLIRAALIELQNKSYISMGNPPNASIAITQIKSNTLIKPESKLFDAIETYASNFKKRAGIKNPVRSTSLDLYKHVNSILQDQYVPEWNALVTKIGDHGHRQKGKSKSHIKGILNRYSNQWMTINYLWAKCLKEMTGEGSAFHTLEQLLYGIHGLAFMPVSDVRKNLVSLREDVGFVEMKRLRGKPTYGVAEPFHEMMLDYTRKTKVIFDDLVRSLE